MKTADFDYHLPGELIAQSPASRRDESRLMHVDRASGLISHHLFNELPALLTAGDRLFVNDSRVFPARIRCAKERTGGKVELLLLDKCSPGTWNVLSKGARLRPGNRLVFDRSPVIGTVTCRDGGGRSAIRFSVPGAGPGDDEAGPPCEDAVLFSLGTIPLPPYIVAEVNDLERYQTIYSRRESSAAAPTAGLHFTEELVGRLDRSGIGMERLELSVGLDTFLPVREEYTCDHVMHSEHFVVEEGCAKAVGDVRAAGRSVIAVGTTVVRALESAALPSGEVRPVESDTTLFITPGYRFRAVDILLTNFHFPRSTLLMLVCAFGGTPLVLEAYRVAVENEYRFFSFGDAMIIT